MCRMRTNRTVDTESVRTTSARGQCLRKAESSELAPKQTGILRVKIAPLYAVGLHVRPRLVFGKLRMSMVGFFPILTVFRKKATLLENAALQLTKSGLLSFGYRRFARPCPTTSPVHHGQFWRRQNDLGDASFEIHLAAKRSLQREVE